MLPIKCYDTNQTLNYSNKGIMTKMKAFQSSGYLGVRPSHLTMSIKVSYKPLYIYIYIYIYIYKKHRTRANINTRTHTHAPKISAGERPCRSPAEILGSNPTGGMDICLL